MRLVLAYHGARFGGWQKQKNNPSIQQALESALTQLNGHPVGATAAGRTDAGVHAWGQVVHTQLVKPTPPKTVQRALNAILPEDILVRSVHGISNGFHAQRDAKHKTYRYRIYHSTTKPLFERSVTHWVSHPLDLTKMRKAAKSWVGRHNFKSFQSTGSSAKTTTRRVDAIVIRKRGAEIWVDITADGFLYHMARRMVGLLIDIGKGKVSPQAAYDLVGSKRSKITPTTAPAKGLCLMQVSYV